MTVNPCASRVVALEVAALDYGIEEARRIKDWPALIEAVDQKIEEQQQFCSWWKGAVDRPGGNRKSLSQNGDNDLSARKSVPPTLVASREPPLVLSNWLFAFWSMHRVNAMR